MGYLVNAIPLASLGLLFVPRLRFANPWLGLLTVVLATYPVFGPSATFRFQSVMIAVLYGLVGLAIVILCVRHQSVPLVPLVAVSVGLFYIASFYGYLLPWGPPWGFHPWMLVFAWPGVGLIAFGGLSWWRHGFAGSLRDKSGRFQLALALTAVTTLASGGFLAYHADPPGPGLGNFALAGPDVPRTSTLIVEAAVAGKQFQRFKYRRPNGAVNNRLYTLYELEVSKFWRGSDPGPLSVVIPDFSPVRLKSERRYLVFLSGPSGIGEWSGSSDLISPQQVWTAEGNRFHPYPGLTPATPITREELAEALAGYPIEVPNPKGG